MDGPLLPEGFSCSQRLPGSVRPGLRLRTAYGHRAELFRHMFKATTGEDFVTLPAGNPARWLYSACTTPTSARISALTPTANDRGTEKAEERRVHGQFRR